MATTLSSKNAAQGARGFGKLLKDWRQRRGHSQLALALHARISARHLSFLETGRSEPSREMVLLLSRALNLPLRETNTLFEAAGFARPYSEMSLSDKETHNANEALQLILENHNPHPAVVMDRYWNILMANDSAQSFFATLLADTVDAPGNVIRLMLHQQWLRPYVVNWPPVAAALLARVQREAVCGIIDEQTQELLDEVLEYPDVRDVMSRANPMGGHQFTPILPIEFRKPPLHARYFSTVTTLGTPQDIALQELRIECFFPWGDAQ